MATTKPAENEDAAVVTPAAADAPAGPEIAETDTGTDYAAAIIADYGVWRAAQPLLVGGVIAFAAGDPVPASHPWAETWAKDGSILPVEDSRIVPADA